MLTSHCLCLILLSVSLPVYIPPGLSSQCEGAAEGTHPGAGSSPAATKPQLDTR